MQEMVFQIDDQLASRLSIVASEQYHGDQNAAISDALLQFFLQPVRQDRRELARLIYEIREGVKAAGGVSEKQIDQAIKAYRQQKKTEK